VVTDLAAIREAREAMRRDAVAAVETVKGMGRKIRAFRQALKKLNQAGGKR
jgi:predicted  nucleic acid-binding Zn-ribbon protein